MAEARRSWIQWFTVGALCLSVRTVAFAQSGPAGLGSPHTVQISSVPSGSLAGRLTDLHSAPLAGVSVVLRNQATGVEVRTTTAKNGAFRIASLDAGEYTLEADAAQLGRGQLEGILITGGNEARVQAAMRFEARRANPHRSTLRCRHSHAAGGFRTARRSGRRSQISRGFGGALIRALARVQHGAVHGGWHTTQRGQSGRCGRHGAHRCAPGA